MEITRVAKNTMPEQVQENMDNIDALNNELDSRPVGLIDKGDWTRGRHYYPQQVVQYNGASYLCTRSIISLATPDTDPLHFKLFASGSQGEQGETGNGIASITKISTVGLVDTYQIAFTDGTTYDYTVTNGQNGTNGQDGNGIASITKISTVGLVDTYRITFTDGTTFDYTVTNGQDGTKIYVNNVEQTSLSFDSDPQTQLNGKQATLTFDDFPTFNSQNPVTSGGIYNAFITKSTGNGSASSYSSKPVTITSSKIQYRIAHDGFKTIYGYVIWNRTNATDSLGVVVSFGTSMSNTDYAVSITPRDTSTNNYHCVGCYVLQKTTTSATVLLQNVNNGTYCAGFNVIIQGF